MGKIWFITGASSGFGRSLAEHVLETGDKAVIAARRLPALEEIASKFGDNVLPVKLDVTDSSSRQSAVADALKKFGRIDVLVNNAGRGCVGALEEYSTEQVRGIIELNLIAPYELTNLLLPTFRKQRSGYIVNFSSVGGVVTFPACGPYCIAKYGLECYSETLAKEVEPLGIKVLIVEPGAFRTSFSNPSDGFELATGRIEDYDPVLNPIKKYFDTIFSDDSRIGDPGKAADLIIEAVNDETAPLRLMLGTDAFEGYEKASKARDEDIMSWRKRGENTAEDK